jgi:hypothetical protein
MVGFDPTTQTLKAMTIFAILNDIISQTLSMLLSLGGRVKPDHGEKVVEIWGGENFIN